MADGSVIIDTELDNSNFKSGLSKIGNIAGKAFKGVTIAIGTVATAFTGLVVASTNARGELEQQIGGIETLFENELGSASDKVIENANKAYKTAGMSATDYMRTATSFSASLLQSLGKDTQKAAEVTDMAIIDMADNANKMGTAMEDIQNAYQGFAKQNYTMLDNLKLGYGGTKTEMERLLADAQKITGIKYDISSLSDVYKAIHVIQEELGITGTTAKEASETLQGSLASLSASWNNFLSGSGDLEQLVDVATDVVKNIVRIVSEAVPYIIDNIMKSLPKLLELGVQVLGQIVEGIITYLPTLMESAGQILNTLIQGILNVLPQLIPVALQIIKMFVMGLISYLPQILEMGINLLSELIKGIAQMLPELIPMAIDCIVTLVEGLLDNIDQLINAGIQLIMALAEGLIEALPRLIEKIPVIIEKLINAIVNNLPKLIEMGITLILKLAEGLIKAIPSLIKAIPQIVSAILNGLGQLVGKVFEIGKNIVKGIWDGISNMANWLWNKISGWCSSIFENIKGFFGIHSPSRLFRDEIGENLGLGIGKGFEDSLGSVYKDMKQAIDSQNAKLTSNLTTNATLRLSKDQPQTVTNYNDKGVNVTQNFYDKQATPYEQQKQAKQQMRRLAYGL